MFAQVLPCCYNSSLIISSRISFSSFSYRTLLPWPASHNSHSYLRFSDVPRSTMSYLQIKGLYSGLLPGPISILAYHLSQSLFLFEIITSNIPHRAARHTQMHICAFVERSMCISFLKDPVALFQNLVSCYRRPHLKTS